ncbi:unnamed protein product [Polarella glacialis]|uniref:Uncharacterized protein n=1 Tax=Polarella glacialis TaxID=89957 RepID=A0A813JQG7_POLGL|nr:unnamed protein product [Polarella glacialis]
MGDSPSPNRDEETEVEANLGACEQGFAEPPPHGRATEEVRPADSPDLTGPGEDPPDWEAPEGAEDERVLAFGDRPPRTRGQRAGVKAQRQRLTKAAAIAQAANAEAAEAAVGPLRAPGAAAARSGTRYAPRQGAGIVASSTTPRKLPQFLSRRHAELHHAGRSRSPARRWQKAGRRNKSSRPAQPSPRATTPSVAPSSTRWGRGARPSSDRASSSPSSRPAVSLLESASGSATARGSASGSRPRAQLVPFRDLPEPRSPTPPSPHTPEEEPVRTDLAYLEAQAQLASAKVTAAREAAQAAAERRARAESDKAVDRSRRLDEPRRLIRAVDPNCPGDSSRSVSPLSADTESSRRLHRKERLAELTASCDELRQLIRATDPLHRGGPQRPASPLPADVEISLHGCSAERLAELSASFRQVPTATPRQVPTATPQVEVRDPRDFSADGSYDFWAPRRRAYWARRAELGQKLRPDQV